MKAMNKLFSNKYQKTMERRSGLIKLFPLVAILLSLGVTQANEITPLNFQCNACITFGGYCCYDDPYRVNFNGDKCYENQIDRLSCASSFFSNDLNNCTVFANKISASEQCNVTTERFLKYLLPSRISI